MNGQPPFGPNGRAEWILPGFLKETWAHVELKSTWLDAIWWVTWWLRNIDEAMPVVMPPTFDVSRSDPGVQGHRVSIETGLGGGDCGFGFEIGRQYLVYAKRTESGKLATGIWTATAPIEESGANLADPRGEPILPGKSASSSSSDTVALCSARVQTHSLNSDQISSFASRKRVAGTFWPS